MVRPARRSTPRSWLLPLTRASAPRASGFCPKGTPTGEAAAKSAQRAVRRGTPSRRRVRPHRSPMPAPSCRWRRHRRAARSRVASWRAGAAVQRARAWAATVARAWPRRTRRARRTSASSGRRAAVASVACSASLCTRPESRRRGRDAHTVYAHHVAACACPILNPVLQRLNTMCRGPSLRHRHLRPYYRIPIDQRRVPIVDLRRAGARGAPADRIE